jgi:hypothetical protein
MKLLKMGVLIKPACKRCLHATCPDQKRETRSGLASMLATSLVLAPSPRQIEPRNRCTICQGEPKRSPMAGNFRPWWSCLKHPAVGPTCFRSAESHRRPLRSSWHLNSCKRMCLCCLLRRLWPWIEAMTRTGCGADAAPCRSGCLVASNSTAVCTAELPSERESEGPHHRRGL